MIIGIATEIGSEGTWQLYVKACEELKMNIELLTLPQVNGLKIL